MDVSKPQIKVERADSFIQFSGFESLRFRGFQAEIYELNAVTVTQHTAETCVCACVCRVLAVVSLLGLIQFSK
jgi:hypothetical protein